ncbi:MAG: hypothetical protein DI551_12545, partial [Micavibrio aeruginosavorus]
TPTNDLDIPEEALQSALKSLKPADSSQILAIIETLDKQSEILNMPLTAYEKHSGLTLGTNYVMPSVGSKVQFETALKEKQIGITVLAILNSLAGAPDNMYSGTVQMALFSMLNVGLIEDAKLLGSETVAVILNKY